MTLADTPLEYLLEDEREAGRLIDKVQADDWVRRTLEPQLAPGVRVLEVGCGPGHLLAAARRAVPGITAVGLDRSSQRLAHLQPEGVELHQGEAERLPFATGSFDVVYTRFMLEYLPDPLAAVREMRRVCKPGGQVVLQDLDAQLVTHYPPDPELEEGLAQVLRALNGRLDPFMGRKLFSLAGDAGLEDRVVQVEPYHLIAGTADPETLRLWDLKLELALPAAAAVLGSDGAKALKARFVDYLRRPDTLTYSMLFTVRGVVTSGSASD